MITSKQRSLIGLAALFAIASTQACGSDTASTPTASAGAPGAAGAPGSSAGAPGLSAGAPGSSAGAPGSSAGAPGSSAGAPAGGAPASGGGPAGAGSGNSSGSGAKGGSTGSAGGSAAGAGAGGGGSTASFVAVKALIISSCATSKCHDSASGHSNFHDGDLYTTLTTALPTTSKQMCKGSTLVTSGNAAGSFLVKLVTGPSQSTCKDSGKDSNVDRMPDKCGGASPAPACLTTAQIKTISDWITAGVPK